MPAAPARLIALLAVAGALSLSAPPANAQNGPAYSAASEAAYQTALDAYLYFYPLVVMDLARRQQTNINAGAAPGRAPANTFVAAAPSGPAEPDRAPADDTIKSAAWVDLRDGPVVLHVPATLGRYYALTVADMWRDVIGLIGKRTTGTEAGDYLLVPAGWAGTAPAGMQRIIATTSYLRLENTLKAFGEGDAPAARSAQNGFRLTPLAALNGGGGSMQIRSDPTINMMNTPIEQADKMDAGTFYSYAAEVWRVNPSHVTDQPLVAQLARLGMQAGRKLDFEKIDPRLQHAMRRAVRDGAERVQQAPAGDRRSSEGWAWRANTLAAWGNDYLERARAVRQAGTDGTMEDVMSARLTIDAGGHRLHGSQAYLLHFDTDALPPTRAGWSLAANAAQGVPSPRPEDRRHAIGDHDPIRYNADGSFDLYLSATPPADDTIRNWLASPAGAFELAFTVYAPHRVLRERRWSPPAAQPQP